MGVGGDLPHAGRDRHGAAQDEREEPDHLAELCGGDEAETTSCSK